MLLYGDVSDLPEFDHLVGFSAGDGTFRQITSDSGVAFLETLLFRIDGKCVISVCTYTQTLQASMHN